MRLRDPLIRVLRTTTALNIVNALSNEQPRVLMWHRFGPVTTDRVVGVDLFDEQMRLLRNHFDVVSVTELIQTLVERRSRRNMVAVTIDDGYEDFHQYALPVLARYRIPAMLYATTGFIDRRLWLWPDYLRYAIHQSKQTECECGVAGEWRRFPLRTPEERERAWNDLADHVLTLPHGATAAFIRSVIEALKTVVPDAPTDAFRALTWDQLRDVAKAGIEIGGHSATHPLLTRCTEDEVDREVFDSKHELENQLQQPVDSFAYPHGICDAMVRRAVSRAGYVSGVSGTGTDYVVRDLFDIKRFGSGHHMVDFRSVVYGVQLAAARVGLSF